MEAMSEGEITEIVRLVEITSDAVALVDPDGTVIHVNHQLLSLMQERRRNVVDVDIKDLLFSADFERSQDHRLPFTTDGSDNTLMLKLADGSFIPVRVRALGMIAHRIPFGRRRRDRDRLLVVIKSLEEQYENDRRTRRLLSQLQSANKRLSGTLSIIMSTVGSRDMPQLLDTVLNRLVDTLDAGGATIYFAENGGFKLRGTSSSLADRTGYLPEFVPFGSGVATYVLHVGKPCRFSVVAASGGGRAATLYDLDTRESTPLRMQDTPPFKALIAVPVYFGTQVLGVIELGWMRPTTPRESDVRVLEVVCDYLSIELVGLVSAMRAQRTSELTRSLNRLRDTLFAAGGDRGLAWRSLITEASRALSCHMLPILRDRLRDRYLLDFEGGNLVELPGGIDGLFFSTTAPASRTGVTARTGGFGGEGRGAGPSLARRLARIDLTTPAGRWLRDQGMPCQGAFVDLGPDAVPPETSDGGSAPVDTVELARSGEGTPRCMFLLLRDASQEPVDDIEYDYLERLIRDYELIDAGECARGADHQIAQALQIGMRNALGEVPGIACDSLYSSATKQALVGGDFYTLIRLPDDRAVMILGDVSGKGVEAASMSAMAKTALTAYAWEGMTPATMVRALNRMLTAFSRVETFVTVFVVKIDLRARVATYCSAGHPPTMLVHPGRELELLTVQSGVVGAFDTMRYTSGSFEFDPGDLLFMYTDGAIEARDPAGEFFGEQRLRDTVLSVSSQGVHGLCEQVLARLDEFTASALDDDVAMVALELGVAEETAGEAGA
ncbi:SpoIIE family protein phosphatase [Collinsella vaginalis]|uniref:SpoIIE family protein phosphatase n=1 Tax=Collinsella vaginalis TaxID=1870987 RepID=UPI000A271602|nr:SpoIIE family protein phosphatase [Collinsella vaginalis]